MLMPICLLSFSLSIFILNTHAKTAGDGTQPKVLVFGGNGFMGSESVELLVTSGFNVTVVNRGNLYWDSGDRIFPLVYSVKCDRQDGFKECPALKTLMAEEDIHFDAVVDFSAYHPTQVRDAVDIVKDKADLYILISTDSVYDVCEIEHDYGEACKETDAVRHKEGPEKHNKESTYTYGHGKLIAEEELVEQRKDGAGIPYVILRLPDVIGPRDVTHRWWIYQLWLKVQSKLPDNPVTVPEPVEKVNISLVYSPDVAKLIVRLVKKEIQANDEVFNLAWPELTTLKQLLKDISVELGEDIEIETVSRNDVRSHFFLYPSARRGPIDVSKATEKINWTPTPWKEALKETVAFYEAAMKDEKFHTQMNEVIQMVEGRLPEKTNKTKLYDALEALYNISLKHFKVTHDEL